MSSIFDKHRHLSQSALQALKTGTLSEDELQQAAAHLADCESCANAFAGCFDTDELAEVPSGFADEVESKLYRKKKDNIQFIFYSIRLDDSFLFSIDKFVAINGGIFQKRRLFAGILLLLLGVYLIWTNIMNSLHRYIPQEVYNVIRDITRIAPQIVLGIAIVVAGVRLVIGKRKERDNNA